MGMVNPVDSLNHSLQIHLVRSTLQVHFFDAPTTFITNILDRLLEAIQSSTWGQVEQVGPILLGPNENLRLHQQ